MDSYTLICGDCLDVLPTLEAGSVDAVITDPPYGAGVAAWDHEIPPQIVLDECLRVSSGPVLWFGGAVCSLMARTFEYEPKPERILIWNVSFTLSRAAKNGMYYRWQPIYCWRLPIKTRLVEDVLREPTEARRQWFRHPGMKPLKLMERLVRGIDADAILDPFMGSGTTGVACLNTGRRFIGIELDPGYFDIARQRLEAASAQKRLAV